MRTAQERKALERAIAILGSQRQLADHCGTRQQTVSKWLKNGVPPIKVISIERAVNGAVTRYDLRPDIYPREG
jgi:DNA-binding transcriptional regulator YdaS (Cro superfamily)